MTTQQMDTVGADRGGRISRQRKRDAVLRLLRGEDLDTVSRSLGVSVSKQWWLPTRHGLRREPDRPAELSLKVGRSRRRAGKDRGSGGHRQIEFLSM